MIPILPKIYHITHIENLKSIIDNKFLYSDAYCLENHTSHTKIGMDAIKYRRLNEIFVKCNPNTKVGEYVPFYFCPRSVMLYIINKGNHPNIGYKGSQNNILHLEADMKNVISWAQNNNTKWAFSDINAGAYCAEFYNNLNDLNKINENAVVSTNFTPAKQAEFLLYKSFPIDLIDKIGVIDSSIKFELEKLVKNTSLETKIYIEPTWYF